MTDQRGGSGRDGDGDGKRGFLKRWSRLKLEEAERQPPEPTLPAEAPIAEAPPAEEPLAEAPLAEAPEEIAEAGAPARVEGTEGSEAGTEEPFDPADLPDIDSLDKDSDYTGFLKEGVPAKLRHMALQKLFRSDPVLAVLDGLNDYDEDFTLAKVAEKIVSSYKPGRGYVDDEDGEDETEDIETGDIEADGIEADDIEAVDIEDGDVETGDNEDGDIETGGGEDTELAKAPEKETGRKRERS